MEIIRTHKKLLAALSILALLVAGNYLYWRTDQANSDPIESTQPEPVTDNSKFMEEDKVEEPEPDEPQKTPAPSTTVVETPAVYTTYGHSPEKPLPVGQATSTSCTTSANVECYIIFKNGSQEINFEPMTTDADGGAVWLWTGGEEVTSGTWSVTAVAGDKTSDEEIIYVQ